MRKKIVFLAYATANEGSGCLLDAAKIRQWPRSYSGIEWISVCLAVSQVLRLRKHERCFGLAI
jgi:hypothetical protein